MSADAYVYDLEEQLTPMVRCYQCSARIEGATAYSHWAECPEPLLDPDGNHAPHLAISIEWPPGVIHS